MITIGLLLCALFHGGLADSVTYGDLGTFTYGSGTSNCHHDKPESPSAIVIRYYLYTTSNWNNKQTLSRTSSSSISGSNFNANRDTKFIIHGWTDVYTSSWVMNMKNAFLGKSVNVILVDWEEGASRANYAQSRANTRVVGKDIAKMMEKLKSVTGASYGSMHIIGHSLGAHTAGYAGKARSNVGRITGLDPAGPEFTGCENYCKISKSDATFVDVIHSDGELTGAGLLDQLGHQDFYPNGGENMPGCSGTPVTDACDHFRAVLYFTESISSSCNFSPSKKCSDWDSYPNCNSCGTCPEMGYGALKSKGSGAYYVQTNSNSPYCQ
ncbi:pancreatic triacylglycerol lipase-like [Diadema antillarum]|uniref:pancreatic triacylglycerol lipase-like n=1 Tax=Diadema antillarum TaxID=105358 RepID=UPI003A87B5F0